ncbi:MAG: homoserine dehydrogenase [Planctomycetes bacterium]|nr:homoserine dehydrogenase [Planctomycetota bacterium]
MDPVRVGIIGLGTVGGGVARVLLEKRDFLRAKGGVDLQLARCCDVRAERAAGLGIPPGIFATDAARILDADDIDVAVELIGGTTIARDVSERALRAGKHLVTANKALLAVAGWDLAEIARERGVDLRFEAAVAGGVPVIKALREGLVGNRIQSIAGILNGTSNYILHRMTHEGLGFEEALREAQRSGFAEADPTLDVSGGDASHKLTILASLGFSTRVPLDGLLVEGIDRLRRRDVEYARELGYVIKPLAIARRINGAIDARVHPTLIPRDDVLASVPREYNAVLVHGDVVGATLYFGKGAGRFPTSSAVVADLVDIAREIGAADAGRLRPFVAAENLALRSPDEIVTRYYLRLTTLDLPGVIGKVGTILGDEGVSLSSVIQKEPDPETPQEEGSAIVPVVFVTHETKEGNLRSALAIIDRLPFMRDETVVLRIEERGE